MDREASPEEVWRGLYAREQLRELKARYFRCLDRRDRDGFRSVFADDAVLEVPEVDLTLRGVDEIVDTTFALTEGAVTVHHGHTVEFTFTTPTEATGVWAMSDIVEWPADKRGRRAGISGAGHYEERYVIEGGEWRIANSRLVRLRLDQLKDL